MFFWAYKVYARGTTCARTVHALGMHDTHARAGTTARRSVVWAYIYAQIYYMLTDPVDHNDVMRSSVFRIRNPFKVLSILSNTFYSTYWMQLYFNYLPAICILILKYKYNTFQYFCYFFARFIYHWLS